MPKFGKFLNSLFHKREGISSPGSSTKTTQDVSSSDEPNIREIPEPALEIQSKIDADMFGEVWKGRLNGCTEVAIKILKPDSVYAEELREEVEVLKKIRHVHLVEVYAAIFEKDSIQIAVEYMCNGNLHDYLRENNCQLTDHIDMASQIASGMVYLEHENYVHGDLRAATVLVGENRICKVADYGLGRLFEDEEYLARQRMKWTAPEAALHQVHRRLTVKSDVWSFGILITEIITNGRLPYPAIGLVRDILELVERGYRMLRPPTCPESLFEQLLLCWHADELQRPTFQNLQGFLEDFFTTEERDCQDIDDL